MNIEKSYIIDLDHLKVSSGIFFFLSCLMESFFSPAFRTYFLFVKNTLQKAANLMFGLILPVLLTPAWFLGGQYIYIKKDLVFLVREKEKKEKILLYSYGWIFRNFLSSKCHQRAVVRGSGKPCRYCIFLLFYESLFNINWSSLALI